MDEKYIDFAVRKAEELINIDSPTGFTDKAAEYVKKEFEKLGFSARYTTKGGVIVDLGGEDEDDGIIIMTHIDTIGAMVSGVKGNGRLSMAPLGGLHAPRTGRGECKGLYKGWKGIFRDNPVAQPFSPCSR